VRKGIFARKEPYHDGSLLTFSRARAETRAMHGNMRRTRKVAIFGGSFNPPHVAHLLATALVLATREVELVLVVPTYNHPFAKPLAPYEDRVIMCTLAMGWLPRVEISSVEQELGGESRTLRTLEHLQAAHPDWAMQLVLGSDAFAESSKWYRFDLVRTLAPPIVLRRSGEGKEQEAILPPISSTHVRARIAAGAWGELQEIVPSSVLSHIRERGLYQAE
jgi:nicotinate-nucleotide adenylyltransferase